MSKGNECHLDGVLICNKLYILKLVKFRYFLPVAVYIQDIFFDLDRSSDYGMHVCAIYGLRTVCPNIGVMLSNENVPVWINHVFHVIYLVSSTRIMCGTVTVKIIVHVARRL